MSREKTEVPQISGEADVAALRNLSRDYRILRTAARKLAENVLNGDAAHWRKVGDVHSQAAAVLELTGGE